MTSLITKSDSSQPAAEAAGHLFDNWFDPIKAGLRGRVGDFIHAMIEGELNLALSRPRYARQATPPSGEAKGAGGVNRRSKVTPIGVQFRPPSRRAGRSKPRASAPPNSAVASEPLAAVRRGS